MLTFSVRGHLTATSNYTRPDKRPSFRLEAGEGCLQMIRNDCRRRPVAIHIPVGVPAEIEMVPVSFLADEASHGINNLDLMQSESVRDCGSGMMNTKTLVPCFSAKCFSLSTYSSDAKFVSSSWPL